MRAASLIILCAAISLPAAADDLIARAKAVSSEGPLYNYEMKYSDNEVEEARGTVYPTAPEGERLRVSYPAEADWPDGFAEGLAEMDADTDGEIWCTDFLENVPDSAERTSETGELITYTFTPEPGADADGGERKLFRNMLGTVSIDPTSASVQSFQMHLPEPVKPSLLAKIETFSMFAECAPSPDGRTYVQRFDLDISGSALGQSFSETVSREITRLLEPVARPLP